MAVEAIQQQNGHQSTKSSWHLASLLKWTVTLREEGLLARKLPGVHINKGLTNRISPPQPQTRAVWPGFTLWFRKRSRRLIDWLVASTQYLPRWEGGCGERRCIPILHRKRLIFHCKFNKRFRFGSQGRDLVVLWSFEVYHSRSHHHSNTILEHLVFRLETADCIGFAANSSGTTTPEGEEKLTATTEILRRPTDSSVHVVAWVSPHVKRRRAVTYAWRLLWLGWLHVEIWSSSLLGKTAGSTLLDGQNFTVTAHAHNAWNKLALSGSYRSARTTLGRCCPFIFF